jgi:hypothetical protein
MRSLFVMNDAVVHDVAFSFAGEQRDYVEQVVTACRSLGIDVFYDRDHEVDFWGKHSIVEFRKAYGGTRARYVVAFISKEYLGKRYPMDELRAALLPSITKQDDYLLPVTFGDVEIPPELLDPAIIHLRAEDYTPAALADAIQRRVATVKSEGQPPLELAAMEPEPSRLRLPVMPPDDFSVYEELRRVLEYLGQRFQAAAQELRPIGFICTVERADSEVKIRIERHGGLVYGLDIRRGTPSRDDALNFVVGGPRRITTVNSSNGWAKPYFDLDDGVAKLEMHDLSVFSSFSTGTTRYTKEEFFEALWNRIVDQLSELSG